MRTAYYWRAGTYTLRLGSQTRLMGVLNITPDSFSDGGLYLDADQALSQALRMEREGADIIDVGGESTRPGSKPVSAKEELRRVLPVVAKLKQALQIPISVDTSKYEVAAATAEAGASIINDVTGLRKSPKIAKLAAQKGLGLVLMHMQNTPQTMQKNPRYANVVSEVSLFLKKQSAFARSLGVHREQIVLDPGFGFGKTFAHNEDLLRGLNRLSGLGFPLVAGLSRKSFIGHVIGQDVSNRLFGSLGAAAVAIWQGACILRVHDVLAHKEFSCFIDRYSSLSSKVKKKAT